MCGSPGSSPGELPPGAGCALSPCPTGAAAGDGKWESLGEPGRAWESLEVRGKEFAIAFFSATRTPGRVNRNKGRVEVGAGMKRGLPLAPARPPRIHLLCAAPRSSSCHS